MTERSAPTDAAGADVHRLFQEIERVGEAVPRRGANDGRGRDLLAALLERQQTSGEVPAVDRRHVARQQRLEVLRVVPVEQVALVVRQARDAVERPAHAQRQLARAEVAEVVGRERREEHQTDVRRRRAVGRLLVRLLLVVVDRQPLIVGADERVEEAPGPAREQPQRPAVVRAQRLAARREPARSPSARSRAPRARMRGTARPRRAPTGRSHATSTATATATSRRRPHQSARTSRAAIAPRARTRCARRWSIAAGACA